MSVSQNTYERFEAFLIRHNLFKYNELMKNIKSMKLLDKVKSEELEKLLDEEKNNPLWEMISDIPFATVKSKICNKEDLNTLIENSNKWAKGLTDGEWTYLFYKKYQNQKNFLTHICHKNAHTFQGEVQYQAAAQNLPWNTVKLKNCTLITPMDTAVIKELSTSLKLCTYDNRKNIGPKHQKMIVFNKDHQPVAFLTIYPKYNCFAVSGKNNSRVDHDIEEEIKAFLIKENILRDEPYLIDNQGDFSKVNTEEKYFSDYDLERLLQNNKKLALAMFPNIEEKIKQIQKNKEEKREKEKQEMALELKNLKGKLLEKVSDPTIFKTIQEKLIKKVNKAETGWELRDIEFLMTELLEDDTDDSDDDRRRLLRRLGSFIG